jgi:hypothetical protein
MEVRIEVERVKEKTKLQSARLLLEIAQKEYENQENRLQILYRRTEIAMAAVGVSLAVIWKHLPMIEGKFLLFSGGINASDIPGLFCFISLIFGLAAVFFLFRGLFEGEDAYLDLSQGFEEKDAQEKDKKSAFRMAQRYRDMTLENRKAFEKRQRHYKTAIVIWVLSLIEFAAYLATTLV